MSKRRKRFIVKYKKKNEISEVWIECISPRKVKKIVKGLGIDFRFPMVTGQDFDWIKIVDTKKCTNLKEKSVVCA